MPGEPGDRFGIAARDPHLTEMPHDFGNTTRHEQPHRWMEFGAVGEHVDEPTHHAVDVGPLLDARPWDPCGEGHCRYVQQQIGRTAACCMDRDGVVERVLGQDIFERCFAMVLIPKDLGRLACDVQPNRLSARCERRVRRCHTQRFGDDLARRCGSQELATTPGGTACAAPGRRCLFERNHSIGVPGADRLDFA